MLCCPPQLPEIFKTDQGSRFTAAAFTGVLKRHGIRITPDEAYFG